MTMKIILLIFLISFVAFAQDQIPGPITINSDYMEYYGNENKSTFTGSVTARSDDYSLDAGAVDVYFTKENNVSRIICRDNVSFISTDIKAKADHAEIDQQIKTIYLTGNAKIHQKETYLEGEKMTIQYENREIFVDKGQSGRVTVIFNPDNMSDIK